MFSRHPKPFGSPFGIQGWGYCPAPRFMVICENVVSWKEAENRQLIYSSYVINYSHPCCEPPHAGGFRDAGPTWALAEDGPTAQGERYLACPTVPVHQTRHVRRREMIRLEKFVSQTHGAIALSLAILSGLTAAACGDEKKHPKTGSATPGRDPGRARPGTPQGRRQKGAPRRRTEAHERPASDLRRGTGIFGPRRGGTGASRRRR